MSSERVKAGEQKVKMLSSFIDFLRRVSVAIYVLILNVRYEMASMNNTTYCVQI